MAKVSYLLINLKKNNNLRSILSLKSCLQQSIDVRLTQVAQVDPLFQDFLPCLSPREIPLTPIVEPCQCVFRSAIAFKLANYSPLAVDKLASQLLRALGNDSPKDDNTEGLIVTVQIIERNWLIFNCDYRQLQVWLAHLSQQFLQRSQPAPSQGITAPSPAAYCQYAHARACSLLRLLDQQKLGPLTPDLSSQPICLSASARSLLEQLLRVTDHLTGYQTENWLKVAVHLSEAFLSFDKNFNLANHQEEKNSGLLNFQRLLLINTRFILQELLITQLSLAAPEEL